MARRYPDGAEMPFRTFGTSPAAVALATASPDGSTVTGQFQFVLLFLSLAMPQVALDL